MDLTRRPYNLDLRARHTAIQPGPLLEAFEDLAVELAPTGVSLVVQEPTGSNLTYLTVNEAERSTRIHLSTLSARLGKRGVEPTREGLTAALREWVDIRPVTDAEAAANGIAVMGWTRKYTEARWQVVVRRPNGLSNAWVPTIAYPRDALADIRRTAHDRATRIPVTDLQSGDVVIWTHLDDPRLSSAALADPSRLTRGEPLEDLWVVFTPGRPLAVASHSAATRLAEELQDHYSLIPLSDIDSTRWA